MGDLAVVGRLRDPVCGVHLSDEEVQESPAELDGEGVVEERVDGAVDVDHQTTEQKEPEVVVQPPGE